MGYKDEINEPVSGRVSAQVSPQVSRKGLADAELDRAAGEPSNHHYHYSKKNTQETFISKGDLPLHLSTNKKRKHIEVW